MHIAVVADLTSAAGAISIAVERLAQILERRPHTPCSVLLPSSAFAQLSADSPGVDLLASRVDFVRTGLGSPDPTVLPIPVLERLLQRETDGAARLGLTGDVLATRHAWPSHLLPILRRNGISGLVVPASEVARPGVVSYLDAVLPVIRSGAERGEGDELVVHMVTLDTVEGALESIPVGCATTVGAYLRDHEIVGRAELVPATIPTDAELDLLRRKAIRLSTRIPERTADEVLDRLAAVAATLFDPPSGDSRGGALWEAHRNLIAARRAIDVSRRRGDDWAKVTRLDWDGDGREDLHIELPEVSLVLDLAEGGTVMVLDDKQATRPLGTLVGGPIGHLLRHQEPDGESVAFGSLTVDLVEESHDRTRAGLSGEIAGGSISCDLTLDGFLLRLRYRLAGARPGRFGPELALALPGARIRVDGGEWRQIGEEPTVTEGHRFRVTAEDERTILISSLTPGQLFVRATAGGIVLWTHWISSGDGAYDVTIDFDA